AAADLFTGDPDSYTFGAVVLGRVNGNVVVPVSMDVMSVSFDKVSGNVYEIVLKDGSSKKISELSDYQIFYLYYQMPEIRYVKAGIERDQNGYRYISDVTGQMTDGTNVTGPTYNKNYFTINGFDVKQNQKLAFKVNGIKLTQDVGSNTFRMPAILDDGQYVRYLSYEEIGIGEAGATSTANILNSSGLTMYLRVNNTEIEWSFDGTSWTAFNGLPTIYAVYEERGYDLQITKSVPIDVGEDPVFGIVIESNAITKTSYEIEGYPDSTIQAYPKTETSMGKIKLEVSDGSKIKIKGLGQGTYTITEDGNYNYILTAKSGAINGTGADHQVKNNSTLTIDLDGEKKVELTNTSKEICKITVGSGELTFHKLQDAVDYIKKNLTTKETISMLTDYVMPSSDKPVIPAGYNITLNTASRTGGTHHYTGSQDYATITRSDNSTEGTMITNLGTLTIDNIMIDGNNVEADSAMITSSGTIILTGGTNLTKANNPNGNGGAIYASAGTVELSENSNLVNNNAASTSGKNRKARELGVSVITEDELLAMIGR
ncbi:MAG: hypothetical protein IKQ18_03625, partial [Clostridia bacterium]|nr:hypothetical protein [Clostridia bacterium]